MYNSNFNFSCQDSNNRTYTTDDDGNIVSITEFNDDDTVTVRYADDDFDSCETYETIDEYSKSIDEAFAGEDD